MQRAYFSSRYVLHLVDLVERSNISPDDLLVPLGLSRAALFEPQHVVAHHLFVAVVTRARELTGEPGLGFLLGAEMQTTLHGSLGFAMATAPTLRDAISLAIRLSPLLTSAIGFALTVEQGTACFEIHERAALGNTREVILIWLLVGLLNMAGFMTGRPFTGHLDVAIAEPEYVSRFCHRVRVPMRFGQPRSGLIFDAAGLDLANMHHDRVAHALLQRDCDRELSRMPRSEPFTGKVEETLHAMVREHAWPSLEHVASAMTMSERSLKRWLAAEGTSFSSISNVIRRRMAEDLLRTTNLSIEAIAERVGYSDPANFARAFVRWTGVRPAAFRLRRS
ncbi:MAG TPA: AraC family transcriptional regulator ligand-binding domain-containing protein [Kofleriaceae bacterium]|nr:AraC family transcriptional regulator ligand-binding domain-containing protein [Kofleriaceae bacterium]